MQLSSGAPFWLVLNGLEEHPVTRPTDCHVAIIGAGITGALLADSFAAAGFTVTLLDRRQPSEGSTGACTGLLQYELDVELGELSTRIGVGKAARAYKATAAGIAMLDALIGTLPADCGYARLPSVYLASRRRDHGKLLDEAELRREHGLDACLLTREQIEHEYGFPSHGAIRTTVAGVVDPVRLTRALLARAQSAGAVLCPRTTLEHWSSAERGCELTTDRGAFRADWTVFATGYETPSRLSSDLVDLNSSYALVTFPIEPSVLWADRALVWETARPYVYLRAAEGGRVLIGGADIAFRNAAWRDRLLPAKTRKLERRLRRLLRTDAVETEFSWAGTFGETRDGLPCIGPRSGLPRALFALGYGGNGIVFSVLASQILRDIVLGKGHPDAELFSLERWNS